MWSSVGADRHGVKSGPRSFNLTPKHRTSVRATSIKPHIEVKKRIDRWARSSQTTDRIAAPDAIASTQPRAAAAKRLQVRIERRPAAAVR